MYFCDSLNLILSYLRLRPKSLYVAFFDDLANALKRNGLINHCICNLGGNKNTAKST